MTLPERETTKYGELIGRIDDEFYFLDEIFKYRDDFQGATATVLRPVPKDEYEERNDPDNLREEYRELWQQAVANNDTDDSLDDWMEYVDANPYWDDSGSQYWDKLRELGYSEEEYPVIECTGGGRSFDKNGARGQKFDEVYNEKLLKEIAKVEK